MKKILTAAQAREADRFTMEEIGLDSSVLMERAAMAVRDCAVRNKAGAVLAVCGTGNNGGDGVAAARLLLMNGIQAEVFLHGNRDHLTEAAKHQLAVYRKLGGRVHNSPPDLRSYDCVLDALFGIGLSGPAEGPAADVIRKINEAHDRGGLRVIAVDIPSGVRADDGQVPGYAIRADETVTFSYLKRGHVQYPGREYCGKVTVADIGILTPEDADRFRRTGSGPGLSEPSGEAFTFEPADLLSDLPPRIRRSNKGTYGRVLLAAGGRNMAGAAILCGRAAMNTGCGLVQYLSDESNRIILQSCVPEAIFTPAEIPAGTADERISSLMGKAVAAAAGPGLGTSAEAETLVRMMLAGRGDRTLVLDADALNLAASRNISLSGDGLILTPHPGEMSRLTGLPVKDILDDPAGTAVRFAREHHLICVLKDAATVVTDGERLYINTSGCSGMSTAGAGDVLTGIIASLATQGAAPFLSACLGVYIHGLAGERAMEKYGGRGMTASDIAEEIRWVFQEYAPQ